MTRQMVTNAMDALKKEGVECMVAPYGKLASLYPLASCASIPSLSLNRNTLF